MGITCELTPIVMDELYQLILRMTRKGALRTEDELEEFGLSLDEISDLQGKYAEMAQRYSADVGSGRDEHDAEFSRQGSPHTDLVAWLLSAAREDPLVAETDLDAVVARRYESFPQPRPLQAHPVLHAWMVGHELHVASRRSPAVPAVFPGDLDLRVAVEGFLPHVVGLLDETGDLPELASTAVVWRAGGLCEGLYPTGAGNVGACLNALIGRSRPILPLVKHKQFLDLYEEFASSRNALTHLLPAGGKSFSTEAPLYIRPRCNDLLVEAMTVFVFRQVALELSDSSDAGVMRRVKGQVTAVKSQVEYL